jgi:hypothetical protein
LDIFAASSAIVIFTIIATSIVSSEGGIPSDSRATGTTTLHAQNCPEAKSTVTSVLFENIDIS